MMLDASEGGLASASLPDLVYLVGPHAETCEELRYSLRSVAANLPHRRLWMVGTIPTWVNPESVHTLPIPSLGEKYDNMREKLELAIGQPELTDSFVLMNDDFFVVQPVAYPLPVIHLGSITEYLDWLVSIGKRENEWMVSMRDTLAVVGADHDCYESHIPLHFDTAKLRDRMSAFPRDKVFTATGCYHLDRAGSAGEFGKDVKVTNGEIDHSSAYLSTEDWSFKERPVGAHLRQLFPGKCEYEL